MNSSGAHTGCKGLRVTWQRPISLVSFAMREQLAIHRHNTNANTCDGCAVHPRLSSREMEVSIQHICGYIGVNLDASEVRVCQQGLAKSRSGL